MASLMIPLMITLMITLSGCLRTRDDIKREASQDQDQDQVQDQVQDQWVPSESWDSAQRPPDRGVSCSGDECVEAGVCGDGVLNEGEQCDDGNLEDERCAYGETSCLICASDCQEQSGALTGYCGDGVVQDGEACDGGGTPPEPCAYGEQACVVCDLSCQEVSGEISGFCGDGVRQPQEGCDDGGQEANDGCSADCQPEEGYLCSESLAGCQPICGDGVVTREEACDDENTDEGDYCSPDCLTVTGFCGDLITQSNERCDGQEWCSDECTVAPPPCLSTPEGCPEIEFVLINGGSFEMGSLNNEQNERPVHFVELPSFQLSRSEVTVGQYRVCVNARVCEQPSPGNWYTWTPSPSQYEDHPVNRVTWSQARTFARWVGGDLPSESEWEFAARSGGEQITFPWGDASPNCARARYDRCGGGTTQVCSQVDGFTSDGLCDMSGNVWEWVLDEYQNSYSNAPVDGAPRCADPACSRSRVARVQRGGGWISAPWLLRTTKRGFEQDSFQNNDLGFRVRKVAP